MWKLKEIQKKKQKKNTQHHCGGREREREAQTHTHTQPCEAKRKKLQTFK